MEGLTIIEGKELLQLKLRLESIEQNQLALLKLLQIYVPHQKQSSVPDFISVEEAAKKYETTKQTIYNKIKLFEKAHERKIDRLWCSGIHMVNEVELLQAIRIKSPVPKSFQQRSETGFKDPNFITPQITPRKNKTRDKRGF